MEPMRPVRIRAMRFGWGLALLLLPATATAQEDTITFIDGRAEREGKVTSVSCKEVFMRLASAPEAPPQSTERDQILELTIDKSNWPRSYVEGKRAMDKGEYDKAIEAFQREMKGADPKEWAYQFAAWGLAECYGHAGRAADRTATLIELKSKSPESYFLGDIYRDLADQHIRAKQYADAEKVASEMEGHASSHGHDNWRKGAQFLKATVLVAQEKYREALTILRGLTSDPFVGVDAQCLELRSLTGSGDFGGARSKASALVKAKADVRVMTAAFSALGDCDRKDGKRKEAMLNYLRGITEFDAYPSAEHEYALAYAAIAEAEYAAASTDETIKESYRNRAATLLNQLKSGYGESGLTAAVEAALK